MTHEEKINNMRIATALCNFGFNNEQLDLLVSLYDIVTEKEGKTSLEDICKIEFQAQGREKDRVKKILEKKTDEELKNNEKKMD